MTEKTYRIRVTQYTGRRDDDVLLETYYTWHERNAFLTAWNLSKRDNVQLFVDDSDMRRDERCRYITNSPARTARR